MKRPSKAQIIKDLFGTERISVEKFKKKWKLVDDSTVKTAVFTDIALIKGEGDKLLEIANRMAKAVLDTTPVVETIRDTIQNKALQIPEEMQPLVERLILESSGSFVEELNKLVLKSFD